MSHDSPKTRLDGRSKPYLARACPQAKAVLEEILVLPEVPSSQNDNFCLARAHLGREDSLEPGLSQKSRDSRIHGHLMRIPTPRDATDGQGATGPRPLHFHQLR
jgi:hypothetical protein